MKPVPAASLVALSLAAASLHLGAAETARLRYLAAAYADAAGAGLHLPEGIACGANGDVVIGDTGNNRLVRLKYADKAVVPGPELKSPQMNAPVRVQIDSKGQVYALDGVARRIVRFTPQGEFAGPLAFEGLPDSTAVVVKAFTVDAADLIYVLDVFSRRVLVVDRQGQFQRALSIPDEVGFASDLAVDPNGTIVVLDSLNRRLFAAAKDAKVLTPLGGDLTSVIGTLPASIMASRGILFVAEGNGSTLIALARDGTFLSRQLTQGWDEGTLNYPSQICVSAHDELFVADRDNSRVQIFQLTR